MEDYFLNYIYSIYQNKKVPSSSLGISGGYDSILLLLVIVHIFTISKQKFLIIHCNHIWQKDNIYMEIEIQKFTYLVNSEICIAIPINPLKNEAQSRNWRLNICKRITNYINSTNVQLGHTLSDQLETLLWHLTRGTSLGGLMSLKNKHCEVYNSYFCNKTREQISNKVRKQQIYGKYISHSWNTIFQISQKNKNYFFIYFTKKTINIDRILIENSRSFIKNILNKQKLPYFHDKTNFWIKFMRNRIRILVIPLLRFYVSKKVDNNIIKFRNLIEQDEIFLSQLTVNIINELIYIHTNSIVFKNNFLKLPRSLQFRCLYFILKKYSTKQIDFVLIKQIVKRL
nr:tRNA(Ile)-lysidine synthase [Picochlorum sp. 'soloecismus']